MPADQNDKTLRKYRRGIAAAIEFVRSREKTEGYTSIGLEELIDQQIEVLQGRQDIEKPSYKTRLEKLREDTEASIAGLKQTDPDAFRTPDPDQDVNTRR